MRKGCTGTLRFAIPLHGIRNPDATRGLLPHGPYMAEQTDREFPLGSARLPLELTRFLDANRYPLRSKTLYGRRARK